MVNRDAWNKASMNEKLDFLMQEIEDLQNAIADLARLSERGGQMAVNGIGEAIALLKEIGREIREAKEE